MMEDKVDGWDSVVSRYTIRSNNLEEENRILKEIKYEL